MNPTRRYTCEEAFRRLDDFLDKELSPIEMMLIQEHLEICEACAREFTFEESVIRNVRARLRDVEIPPDLTERILQLTAHLRHEDTSG
jgi:anti-sigma factor (TIGR02949 family)